MASTSPWLFLLKKLLFSSFYLRHTIGRMAKSTNLFLVGLMGAGKSTIGRQLAKSLGCEFIDSDHEIEARTGANIPLIFDVEGEAGFRQREKKIIDDLTQREHIVLATGGGVVLDPENRAHLHARGLVVYLYATVDQLLARTAKDRNRPLLQTANPRARFEELMQVRDPLYREIADLVERSYPIHIDRGRLARPELVRPHVAARQVMIVTNETVAPLYLAETRALFNGFRCETVLLPDGEQCKTLEVLNRIFDALLETHCDRRVTLVALGGGVISDMTGFAAACYQRGVPFIQIPTTLLAQVDSSVGGKTGVNHPLGENMIGAFHQPRCVLIDTDTLNTLPDRELSAGLAEENKYGLNNKNEFFVWLEHNMEALVRRDPAALAEAIERSCHNKAKVVAADEREGGVRALLNLVHTFVHAIETGMGYGTWLHGEAVAAGMYMAADLSMRLGWLTRDDVDRTEAMLRRAGLPARGPRLLDPEHMLGLMAVDKKAQDGQIRLVLLRALGRGVITADYNPAVLRETIAESLTA